MSNWVLLIAGGILQLPAVRAAHELGYKVVVTDRDLNCACASEADHFVELDTFDVQGHVDFIKAWPEGFAAVFTAAADPVVTVARAAAEAGCHGLPESIAIACNRKHITRFRLERCNVPQPQWTLARDLYDITNIYQKWGKDIIVKATGSSGSRGHTRIRRRDVPKPIPPLMLGEIWGTAVKYSHGAEVLIEELLTGAELSVETLWYNGTMIPLNAVERPFMGHPRYAIELGHYNPAVLSPGVYDEVWRVMELAGQAMDMDATKGGHIFKGDLILTDDGPKVLEVTPRLSGGFDSGWTSPLAHGVNYTKGALLLALGEPLEKAMPFFTPRWYWHAVCMAVFGPKEGGIIKKIIGIDEARRYGEVILRFGPGDTLPPLVDCASRAAFCITEASSQKNHAILDAIEMTSKIKVVVA